VSTATHHLDPAIAPERILAEVPEGVRRLATIVNTLYGGSWDDCAEDLRRRQAGKPYLYRIDLPGLDVLTWIHRLKTYACVRGESLVAPPASPTTVSDAHHRHLFQTAENRP
jgi:hypothetical protein